jgi:fermentation-respiration switch protein FrsA (DUF1100 family)
MPAWRMGSRVPGLLVFMGVLCMAPLLGSCDSLFFQPDQKLYITPEQVGLWHEQISFDSGDGTHLSGWFIPAKGKALGTVIHFHGNAANISNHLFAVRWWPYFGYNVFLFDYRGFGRSEGTPSRKGAIEDGVAAIKYVRKRPDVDPNRLVLLGQSLGGAVGLSALARAGTDGFRAMVIESSFVSYREAVRLILDRGWLTWPFQYPIAYLLFTDDLSPRADLPALANLPLLVVHGDADPIVPIAAGYHLYEAFPGPDKAFWKMPGVGHIEAFSPPGSPWREPLLQWLAGKLGK